MLLLGRLQETSWFAFVSFVICLKVAMLSSSLACGLGVSLSECCIENRRKKNEQVYILTVLLPPPQCSAHARKNFIGTQFKWILRDRKKSSYLLILEQSYESICSSVVVII